MPKPDRLRNIFPVSHTFGVVPLPHTYRVLENSFLKTEQNFPQGNAMNAINATNAIDVKRYTCRELDTQAKQQFRQILLNRPEGGSKQDYRYKGWDILINNGTMLQVLNYDVVTFDIPLKRSSVIVL